MNCVIQLILTVYLLIRRNGFGIKFFKFKATSDGFHEVKKYQVNGIGDFNSESLLN